MTQTPGEIVNELVEKWAKQIDDNGGFIFPYYDAVKLARQLLALEPNLAKIVEEPPFTGWQPASTYQVRVIPIAPYLKEAGK